MKVANLESKLEFLHMIDNLSNDNHDVYTWATQIETFQMFCKVVDNEELYTFCTMKINGTGLKQVKENVKTDNTGSTSYPSLNQIVKILCDHYQVEMDSTILMDQTPTKKEIQSKEREDEKQEVVYSTMNAAPINDALIKVDDINNKLKEETKNLVLSDEIKEIISNKTIEVIINKNINDGDKNINNSRTQNIKEEINVNQILTTNEENTNIKENNNYENTINNVDDINCSAKIYNNKIHFNYNNNIIINIIKTYIILYNFMIKFIFNYNNYNKLHIAVVPKNYKYRKKKLLLIK